MSVNVVNVILNIWWIKIGKYRKERCKEGNMLILISFFNNRDLFFRGEILRNVNLSILFKLKKKY